MDEDRYTAFGDIHHRCSNDLQMVAALLRLHAARSTSEEAESTLRELAHRVDILATARRSLVHPDGIGLAPMLRSICEALQSIATPRNIVLVLECADEPVQVSQGAVIAAGLAVNELATNALKHAFAEHGGGMVKVSVSWRLAGEVCLVVEDNGRPFPEVPDMHGSPLAGLGLDLARRTIEAQNGLLIFPEDGSKRFEIRLPLGSAGLPN